eukprot:scaffold10660_cov27-Tisochrysis_lutea.AAC.3
MTSEHTCEPVGRVSCVSKDERRVSQKQSMRPIEEETRMRPEETSARVAPYESTRRTSLPSDSTPASLRSLVVERLHTESEESSSPVKRSASGRHAARIELGGQTNFLP